MNMRVPLSGLLLAAGLGAHPMGNSSVNHYARIAVEPRGVSVLYVLDLAEIPSSELIEKWNANAGTPRESLSRKAEETAREWMTNLSFQVNGREVRPRFLACDLAMDKGAGGVPVLRIASRLALAVAAGEMSYEDRNYAGRAGWKEIVIAAGDGASLLQATHGDRERSAALTAYPRDPTVAPPQDLRASLSWSVASPLAAKKQAPVIVPPTPSAPDTVVRGDFLSQLLHKGEMGWGTILVGLVVAFGLGAMHALSPGHGKTIVAAYLVGNRGTFKHAIFLGAMVTFTHTFSVFCLGFTMLYLYRDVLPDHVIKVLSTISGLSIVWIGGILLYQRLRNLRARDHEHHHHDHDHGPHGHSHVPEGEVTMASLFALGASGGLVPCPSALVLLLASINLGRLSLGLLLLVGFSLGLAVVLMAIGMLVLYAKNLIPGSKEAVNRTAFRVIPVLSAAIIVCLGLLMTGVSLGVITPSRFIG